MYIYLKFIKKQFVYLMTYQLSCQTSLENLLKSTGYNFIAHASYMVMLCNILKVKHVQSE